MKEKLIEYYRNNKLKVVSCGIVLLLVLYFLFSALVSVFETSDIDSDIVESFTYSHAVNGYGIVVRDEQLIVSDRIGNSFSLLVSDGDRVRVGEHIASYYNKELSNDVLYEMTRLNKRIDQLESALEAESSRDIVSFSEDINDSVFSYIEATSSGDYEDSLEKASALQILFDKLDIRKKGEAYYRDALSSAQAELNRLITTNHLVSSYIDAPSAGFFSALFDGYEYLTVSDYSTATVTSFNELMALPPMEKPSGYVGKTQDSPTWYYVAVFNTEDVSALVLNKSVTIEFDIPHVGTKQIPFIVSYISVDNAGQTVVCFRASNVTSFEFLLRKISGRLIMKSYKGLRIPTESIFVSDGQQGVYVLVGHRIVFKPIEVLYTYEEDGSFAVVTAKNSVGSRALMENDEVITGGKDLFDGKVLYVK